MAEQSGTINPEKLIAELKAEAKTMAEYDEKHLRGAFWIKVVLVAFVAGYLGFIYVNFKPVDAKFLVFIAQERVTEALPTAQKTMTDRLTKMAPKVMDQVGEEVMKNLPTLGRKAEDHAKAALNNLSDKMEYDMIVWLADFVRENRAVLDDMLPGLSSYDKITHMRKFIIEDSQEALKGVGDTVGHGLKDHELTEELRRLANGKNLTPKEKLQREVIAMMYLLVQRQLEEL